MTVSAGAQPAHLQAHLEGLRAALVSFVRYADRAGLEAPVPTTPDWTVRRLVAHQGMVHRWAAGQLRGEEPLDTSSLERQGLGAPDPLDWLREGAVELAQAITETPPDCDALVFLAGVEADRPFRARDFWARRQCHETTIHAVDALSASLGRYPKASETWIDPALALDGIDELLTGFMPRPVSRLRAAEPMAVAVLPEPAPGVARPSWLVEVGPGQPVTTRAGASQADALEDADIVLRGSPVALYLTLWNRSDEVTPEGWDLWAEGAAIRWSR